LGEAQAGCAFARRASDDDGAEMLLRIAERIEQAVNVRQCMRQVGGADGLGGAGGRNIQRSSKSG
jgi:hypothetical protein